MNKPSRAKPRKITVIPNFDALADSAYVKESMLVIDPNFPERASVLQISTATLHRWIKAGKFPKQHKFGKRISRWLVREIREWQAQTIDAALALQ